MRIRFQIAIGAIVAIAASGLAWHFLHASAGAVPVVLRQAATSGIPVTAGTVEATDVPVFLTGLGTVQAFNTVVVKARVDGQIDKIAFVEGQDVKGGDVLAQIDPRPFQAALDQAIAAKARDEAQLVNARMDLQRFVNLGSYATRQSVDTQKNLIRQLEATIQNDEAAIEGAQVQLNYTTIAAPIPGRTGIRQVDQGNLVHASDINGLVVITQLQPISVIFSLPDDHLGNIVKEMAHTPLKAIALARTDQRQLGQGTLSLVDNQIEQSTDTIRLKATFPNPDYALWPGQFVDIRLLQKTLVQAVTVPSTAVQRGPDGMYVYVIKPNKTVEMRAVTVNRMSDGTAVIDRGLRLGERVVIAGQYRLQPGSLVQTHEANRSFSEK